MGKADDYRNLEHGVLEVPDVGLGDPLDGHVPMQFDKAVYAVPVVLQVALGGSPPFLLGPLLKQAGEFECPFIAGGHRDRRSLLEKLSCWPRWSINHVPVEPPALLLRSHDSGLQEPIGQNLEALACLIQGHAVTDEPILNGFSNNGDIPPGQGSFESGLPLLMLTLQPVDNVMSSSPSCLICSSVLSMLCSSIKARRSISTSEISVLISALSFARTSVNSWSSLTNSSRAFSQAVR